MKKFTALMLVAICLVVGGVYASWTYATGNITEYYTTAISPTLAAKTDSVPFGTIAIASNTLEITITDNYNGENQVASGTPGDYIAEVNYAGALKVTFTPGPGASEQILASGLPLEMVIEFTDNKYLETAIFSAADATLSTTEIGTYTKNDDGSFTWTVTGAQLATKITFNGGSQLILDTEAEYDAFKAAMNGAKITFNIGQEGQVATGTPAQNG